MRPRAGIDMDGVLYNWNATVRDLLRRVHGLDISDSQNYDWVRNECRRLGKPEAWTWLWESPIATHIMFREGKAYPDAAEAMQTLAETHDVVIITRRPRGARRATLQWLAENEIAPSELLILHDSDKDRPKSSVPCDWYVDDSPAVVEELWRAGKKVFIMDRTWNRELAPEVEQGLFARVSNFEQLLRQL